MLGRMRIETEKVYDNCSMILKEFDRDNCQFSKDVEILLNVYANASKNVTIFNSVDDVPYVFIYLFLLFFLSSKAVQQFCGHKCPQICSSSKWSFIIIIWRFT